MILGMIGPWEIIWSLFFLVIPIGLVFFIGYTIGKKKGYQKRVRETEQ